MARYKAEKISYKVQDRLLADFCATLTRLDSTDDVQQFLKDLLNRQERLMIVRRLLIAEMIEQKCTYREIKKKFSCGGATIARVARWLNFGRGGYKRAIRKIGTRSTGGNSMT